MKFIWAQREIELFIKLLTESAQTISSVAQESIVKTVEKTDFMMVDELVVQLTKRRELAAKLEIQIKYGADKSLYVLSDEEEMLVMHELRDECEWSDCWDGDVGDMYYKIQLKHYALGTGQMNLLSKYHWN